MSEKNTNATDVSSTDILSVDGLGDSEVAEIVQNLRVDAPSGEMPLNAILYDLMVAHNKIEQYRKAALTMHKAVDERLQEAESVDADSPQCDVLEETKDTAMHLYERLQEGEANQ